VLGAQPRLVLLASGSLVGLLLGVAASRVLSAIVFQAKAQDPLVLHSTTCPITPGESAPLSA